MGYFSTPGGRIEQEISAVELFCYYLPVVASTTDDVGVKHGRKQVDELHIRDSNTIVPAR